MPVLARYSRKEHLVVSMEQKSLFMTLRTVDSFCRSCSSSVTFNTSIPLTIVTAYGLNELGLDNNLWPIFVSEML